MYCNGVTVLLGRVDRFAVHLMAESLKATKCVSHLCNVCKVSTSCATETGVTNVDALESLSRLLFDWWLQVICFTAGRFFGLTELTGRCLASCHRSLPGEKRTKTGLGSSVESKQVRLGVQV